MKTPFVRYRPTRTNLGGGKFQEIDASPVTMWGIWREHEANMFLIVDTLEDIEVGDIIEIEEEVA